MKQSKFYKEQMDDKFLNTYFEEIRNEDYDNSFDKTKNLIVNKSHGKSELSFLSKIKWFLILNKMKFAVMILFVSILAACNYPVNSVDTLGYALTFKSDEEKVTSISKEIEKLNLKNSYSTQVLTSKENSENIAVFTLIFQNTSDIEINEIQNKISSIIGVTELNLTSLTEEYSQPVYAYVLDNFLNVKVNSTGKTEEELTNDINDKLKKAGMVNTKIKVVNENGHNRLVLEKLGSKDNFDIKVGDDNNLEVLKIRQGENDGSNKFDGLNENEIRNMIKQENPGLSDEDIILRKELDKNGKEIFKVEINKEN